MANTPHLGITLLEQSQAQKEVTVNEALYRIDALLNSGVIDKDLATPPASPAQGDVYIVASSPTGAWSGKTAQVAYFDQIWRFIVPNEGLMVWVRDEDKRYVYNGSAWIVVEALPSSGDMATSTYDPANIAQQVVGTTATQTLTNKTLTSPTINDGTVNLDGGTFILPQSTSPTPTVEGSMGWDTDDNLLLIGDGSAAKTFYPVEIGSFTGTCTGAITGSVACNYVKVGRFVTLSVATRRVAGASSATPITISGAPSSINSAAGGYCGAVGITDAGSDQTAPGAAYTTATTTLTIYKNFGGASFSSSASTTGFYGFTVSYYSAT